jgi:hypothetical protein
MRSLACGALAVFLLALPAAASGAQANSTSTLRDGSHDFDFEIGTWKSHSKRLLHPLTGSKEWVSYDGIAVVSKIWDGHANLVDLQADGSVIGHVEGLSLRLYDPQAHQWLLYYANSKGGVLSPPPTVGEFANGRGVFYDQEPINGRTVLVRNVWSDITPTSCHFEQAFSNDWGKTWETNLITTDTRIDDASRQPH